MVRLLCSNNLFKSLTVLALFHFPWLFLHFPWFPEQWPSWFSLDHNANKLSNCQCKTEFILLFFMMCLSLQSKDHSFNLFCIISSCPIIVKDNLKDLNYCNLDCLMWNLLSGNIRLIVSKMVFGEIRAMYTKIILRKTRYKLKRTVNIVLCQLEKLVKGHVNIGNINIFQLSNHLTCLSKFLSIPPAITDQLF